MVKVGPEMFTTGVTRHAVVGARAQRLGFERLLGITDKHHVSRDSREEAAPRAADELQIICEHERMYPGGQLLERASGLCSLHTSTSKIRHIQQVLESLPRYLRREQQR